MTVTDGPEHIEEKVELTLRLTASAEALGEAAAALRQYVPPALARSAAAKQNLYDRIADEFGLLTATEAGHRLGSRAVASRNLASARHAAGQLVAIRRGRALLYPGFQFDEEGQPLPVIAELWTLAAEHGRGEAGLVQWLCRPTTYLHGDRPVDHLADDPDRVLGVARDAWSVDW